MNEDTMRTGVKAIAGLTFVTGAAQAALPGKMLEPLAAENDEATRHLFRTIGMFMVVVGGGLGSTLRNGSGDPGVLLWTGVQKVGASAAVGLGVQRRVFSPLALGVAGFDLLSGLLVFGYRRRLQRR
jgi:hypothetical protein